MATVSSGSRRRTPKRRGRPRVSVLRLGHRAGRDPRLTTHAALAARALGADRMYLHPPDPDLAERIRSVTRRWGGTFEVVGTDDWRTLLRQFDGTVVHLTMYGVPLDRVAPRIRPSARVLLVIGGAKVPFEIYERADYNVAVGAQPHSEVAAVALALDRLVGPVPAGRFSGGSVRIRPSARGKRVVEMGTPR